MTATAAASIARRKRTNTIHTAAQTGRLGLTVGAILATTVIVAGLSVATAGWLLSFPDVFPGNHQPVSFDQLNRDSLSGAIRTEIR